MGNLFTIGYAGKEIKDFIDMLKKNSIDCLVDVRSLTYSKTFPQYNENNLKKIMKDNNIKYLSFKDEFGARRIENEVYEYINYPNDTYHTVVIFDRVYKTEKFRQGILRIKNGLEKGYNICLLCSEKKPFECHRGIMLSEYFYNICDLDVSHIIDNETICNHSNLEKDIECVFYEQKKRFLKTHNDELLYGGGLFSNNRKIDDNVKRWNEFFKIYSREKGFYLQNLLIGYKKGEEENE